MGDVPSQRRDARTVAAATAARLRRRRREVTVVPSRRLLARRHPAIRLFALLAVRDDLRFLPGFVANVAPQVDGIIALDDGSTDGSAEFLAACPEVVELLRVPADRPAWDEPGNFRRLGEAALRHGAGWAVVLDADERVERDFRRRLERVVARGGALGFRGFRVRLRELWDRPDQYRVDGLWGRKERARIFPPRAGLTYDTRPLHGLKVPLECDGPRACITADLEVYHLRMVDAEDRRARRERYERADPDATWQPDVGYAYLTDERGLQVRRIPRARAYEPLGAPARVGA